MVNKMVALIVALMTTFVITTIFVFNAYFTTSLFVVITTYYSAKYAIQTLKKTESNGNC